MSVQACMCFVCCGWDRNTVELRYDPTSDVKWHVAEPNITAKRFVACYMYDGCFVVFPSIF